MYLSKLLLVNVAATGSDDVNWFPVEVVLFNPLYWPTLRAN